MCTTTGLSVVHTVHESSFAKDDRHRSCYLSFFSQYHSFALPVHFGCLGDKVTISVSLTETTTIIKDVSYFSFFSQGRCFPLVVLIGQPKEYNWFENIYKDANQCSLYLTTPIPANLLPDQFLYGQIQHFQNN